MARNRRSACLNSKDGTAEAITQGFYDVPTRWNGHVAWLVLYRAYSHFFRNVLFPWRSNLLPECSGTNLHLVIYSLVFVFRLFPSHMYVQNPFLPSGLPCIYLNTMKIMGDNMRE